jgi:hypothetical protein
MAVLGTFTVGTALSPNTFAEGFLFAVYLGDQTGNTFLRLVISQNMDLLALILPVLIPSWLAGTRTSTSKTTSST